MLTWTDRKVFQFSQQLTMEKEFDMPSQIREGWGMTPYHSPSGKWMLLISDGSSSIYHVNPETWQVVKEVRVMDKYNSPVRRINELEMYKDKLLANIFTTNKVISIDPESGELLATYDFSQLEKDLN